MLTLALDCSSATGSVAIVEGQKVLYSTLLRSDRTAGETLIPSIVEGLASTGRTLPAFKRIITTQGPGRFTGVRIGLNCAKSLSYSLGTPLFLVDSLTALALSTPPITGDLLVVTNAFKNMVFASHFKYLESGLTLSRGPSALTLREFESWVTGPMSILGDAYELYGTAWSQEVRDKLTPIESGPTHVDARCLALSRAELFLKPSSWKDAIPLYLRGSEAEEKLKAGLLKPVEEIYKLK